MRHNPFITEIRLHQNSDYTESQGIIPELIYRLITASIQQPNELRIPSAFNQPGWDGIVDSPIAFEPFVPEGRSVWEIGTGNDPQKKATSDFLKRTKTTNSKLRSETTYIFVTSRSASQGGWSETDQEKWINRRQNKGWRAIKILDATRLEHWISRFPSIDIWLARKFHIQTEGYISPSVYWNELSYYGSPPPLLPIVFTHGKEEAKQGIIKIFNKEMLELRLVTYFPEEAVDLVIATLEELPQNEQFAYSGRCLIIENPETWKTMCQLIDPYILIAKPSLDLGGVGSDLRNMARANNKSVIFSTTPSGDSHGNSILIPETKPFQLYNNLKSCDYSDERARQISEKCKGKITTLKRILLDLSAAPEWAKSDAASEFAITTLIGQWNANEKGDIEAVTGILGKEYGEWIRKIHPLTLRPDPPLTQQNEKWHFISRYEGWFNLGKFVFDDDLERFSAIAVKVLKEKDPKFDLPKKDRWIAQTKGKDKVYSEFFVHGIAETLALMGTFPEALLSTSVNKPQLILEKIIREVFNNSNWMNWATLNNHLPFIAEADPEIFMDILESVIDEEKIIIDLFSQEGDGITGWNYLTGILWSLEALAWNPKYLNRVCLLLSRLALLDPGGNWSNRPYNSLFNIFLPWLKQTTASLDQKFTALRNIQNKHSEIVWELLIDLLPKYGGRAVSPNHKPSWQNFIPEDFNAKYSQQESSQQISAYLSLCMEIIKSDYGKLVAFLEQIDMIPEPFFSNTLDYLRSSDFINREEADKAKVWSLFESIIRKHRKFQDARWALPEEILSKIESVSNLLVPQEPSKKFEYLFNEYDVELYEEKGNFDEQSKMIEAQRTEAIKAIYTAHGIQAILEFSKEVKLAIEVGSALGRIDAIDENNFLIPTYLNSEDKKINDLIRGYVWTKFKTYEFNWVNEFEFKAWSAEQKLQFLNILPFNPKTWNFAKIILGESYNRYWEITNASPYYLKGEDYIIAVGELLNHERPNAGIQVMEWMMNSNLSPDINQVCRALLADIKKDEKITQIDPPAMIKLITWLQRQENVNNETLSQIEWTYIRWLDRFSGGTPVNLHKALSRDPEFFCEVIRTIYKSSNQESEEEVDEERKALASQAYFLLQNWVEIPGDKSDGTIDENELSKWLSVVKKKCSESGHIGIAYTIIGKVFAHSEKDPSGFFIDKKLAKVLDEAEHKEMRSGFTTEKFNMRGVYYGSSGQDEKALSEEYELKANESESEGFIRLSSSLREMARLYRLDAEREAKTDPFDLY